jgi:uncharacterized protein YndB with AHSA1/START domain
MLAERRCVMKEYTAHFDAPPEMVFAAMLDPELQTGNSLRMEVVEETPDGVGSKYRFYFQVLGMRFGRGTYTYAEYVSGERIKMEFSGGGPLMALTGGPVSSLWIFEPADGGTDVTVRPEFKTRIPVVNQLARRMMMRSWQTRDIPRMKAEIEKRAKATTKT